MRDFDLTTLVVREYFSALDCSKSLAAWLLFINNEHHQLLELKFNPLEYNSYSDARDSLAAVSYLSKSDFLNVDFNVKDVALDKFRDCETTCLNTNVRLATGKSCETEIFSASRKIASILRDLDPEKFIDSCNWGPGSTLKIRGDRATAATKFDNDVEVTPSCYQFVKSWFSLAYPSWNAFEKLSFSRFNKVMTVPKNSKTDRVIAVEPSLNLWFQKGIGSLISKRLLQHGIDLRDQGHNQRLSRIGSKFNNLATIDFSSASDTISSVLVCQLLPGDWLQALCALRSPYGYIEGSIVEYEKFSSMGNGFTFELESLIFLALAQAVAGDDADQCSIYGDDLIIPCKYVSRCIEVFDYCGFTINKSKSYWDSYYRESCGKHWWNGVDITPIYLKERINNEFAAYKAHNAIRRLAHSICSYGCDRRFSGVCDYIGKRIEKRFKRALKIPNNIGEGGLIVNFDEASPTRLRWGHEGFIVKFLVLKPYERCSYSHGLLLSRLWVTMGSDRDHRNDEILPRRTRAKIVRSSCAVWYDLGPWI